MNTPKRHLNRHQRQRLLLWALAMLRWIASVLFAGKIVTHRQLNQRHRKMSLEGLERMGIQLLVLRAVDVARLRQPKRYRFFRHGCSLLRRHYFRSLLGSRLRRVIKRKDLHGRIFALIDLLRRMDHYAALLGARMKRQLTRLYPIALGPTSAAPLPRAPAFTPVCADTS